MRFFPAELFILKIIVTLFFIDAVLIIHKGIAIDFVGYVLPFSIGALAILLGQFYRTARNDHGISLALTATGTFIVFSLVGSIFNYCLLPSSFPRIDPYLIEFDAMIGFNWPWFATMVSFNPMISSILKVVYFSSLPQLILVILILGFSKRMNELHTFLITGIIGAVIMFVVWSFLPSFGATSVHDLPQDVLDRMPIAVSPEYGKELVRLSREGSAYISPANVLGLIGFPSFHTVMALMSVVFLRKIKVVWAFALIINLIMVPAIIVEGGHHLADLLGGLGVFVCAYMLAQRVMRQMEAKHGKVQHWQTAGA
jgi:hypothetical protein